MPLRISLIVCLLAAVVHIAAAQGTQQQVSMVDSEMLLRLCGLFPSKWSTVRRKGFFGTYGAQLLQLTRLAYPQVVFFDDKDFSGGSQTFPTTVPATGCSKCTELVSELADMLNTIYSLDRAHVFNNTQYVAL